MHRELKTDIKFDDFWTVFGPRGFVAMAWWLGAQHADRIRKEQTSFPLLYVTGTAQSGKTLLLTYLTRLLGDEPFPDKSSPDDDISTVQLATHLNRPVLVYEVSDEPERDLNLDVLLPLSDGGRFKLSLNGKSTEVEFRGGLAINGPDSASRLYIDSRLLNLELVGRDSTPDAEHSLQVLRKLEVGDAGRFRQMSEVFATDFFGFFNRGARAYMMAILNEHGRFINDRAARNYGQVMALVDILSLLLSLPNEQRILIQEEVQHMAIFERMPI
ncbi:hypothetical protein MQC82_04525 [Pseudomonas viridiflava]|uniref:hypothetical protein n=1 Tax=Pseudomonas viridiflava TaxID=33069 RepID=UPI001F61CF86|nr:hypothetical protein [Pseudomonas viridiflava]MCI3908824.1 hypothetical protein [Pseudomonas viridiflava]